MKKQYFVFACSIITLFSYQNVSSQFEVAPKDGVQLLNNGSEGGGWVFECNCNYFTSFNDLWSQYARIAKARQDSWLRHQENNLKEEIEKRLNQTFNSFRDAQRAFFKKEDGLLRSNNQIRDYQNSLGSQMNTFKNSLNETGAPYRILNLRFKDVQRHNQPPQYDFQQLMYKGKRIMDMSYHEVNEAIGQESSSYIYTFGSLERLYVKEYRSSIIKEQQRLADYIADRWIDFYNSLNSYEDRIRLMSGYLAQNWNSGSLVQPNSGVIIIIYLDEKYRSTVPYLNYQNVLDGWTNDKKMPNKFYNDITDPAEIKFNYAVHQMNDIKISKIIDASPTLKLKIKSHFESNAYSTASINAVGGLMKSYANGAATMGTFFNTYTSFKGQNSDRPEYLANMSKASPSSSSGYRNFSSIIEELSYTATNYASKGNLIREFMAKGGKPIPASLTNEMLGRLFDITGNSGFYALEYSSYAKGRIKDWDYGPYGWAWYGDAFFMEGLKAVSQGGSMYWGDKIIKDPSFIGTKADCILNRLISSGNNLFTRTSAAFTDNRSKYKLRFTTYNDPNDDADARTGLPDTHDIISIKINIPRISGSNYLSYAKTILHEMIHAELHRIKLSGNSGPNALPQEQYNWYLYMWNFYEKVNPNANFVSTQSEHYFMAKNYIDNLAKSLREFNGNQYGIENYRWLAWEGLNKYGTLGGYITNSELTDLSVLYNRVSTTLNLKICDGL